MNGTNVGLPLGMVAGNTAVAGLASVGLLFMMPVPVNRELSAILIPALTALLAAALVATGQRFFERVRTEAFTHATEDPITGLTTVSAAERVLKLEFGAAQRGRPLTVVLIRLEDTAGYSVRNGRAAAEQLMRSAGRVLRKHRRSMHVAAHHHGDGTYLSILSGMGSEGACIYAKRLRKELKRLPGLPEPPIVSAGIVPYDLSMESPAILMKMVERALQRGTRAGGKIVVVGQPRRPAAATA